MDILQVWQRFHPQLEGLPIEMIKGTRAPGKTDCKLQAEFADHSLHLPQHIGDYHCDPRTIGSSVLASP